MTKEQFIAQVEAIQKPLRRFLLALCCGDSQQSDDIAQEAFIKAYLSCDTLSSPEKFNAWIFRACLKTIVNRSEFSERNNNSCDHEHFVG